MWSKIKVPFVWIADKWNQFEVWFAGKVPWLKSKAIALLGAIAAGAASMQEYITAVPLSKVMTAERVAMASFGVLTLIWIVRRLGTAKT